MDIFWVILKIRDIQVRLLKDRTRGSLDGCVGEGMDDLLAAAMGSGAGSMVGSGVGSMVGPVVKSGVVSLVDFTAWGPTGLW